MRTLPNSDEVEITLIGTGGGYGESLVIKIGIDSWIIVDSCINPNNKTPLPLEYLKNINVDLRQVKLLICTHWHSDHIRGLSDILNECENADFCFSDVLDLRKFLILCELDETRAQKGSISSTKEFRECMKTISLRSKYYTSAKADMILFNLKENDVSFTLYSLSPSPKTVADFHSELSELITEFGNRTTTIVKKTPNDKSVVLLLKFGDNRVLLGADLEIGKSENEGWRHIITQSKVIDDKKSNVYKIPHHGSENGYLNEIFDILVNKNSILKLTPFRANKLPTDQMLNLYLSHSKPIYLTSSNNISKKAKKRDNSIQKFIERSGINLTEIKYSLGIVRSRINYMSAESTWRTEIFEAALIHHG